MSKLLKREGMFCAGSFFASLCFVFLIQGCMQVGPEFKKPETPFSDQWSGADADTPAQVSSDEDSLADWWVVFQDDTLTALMNKALSNNFDIQIAASRIRQARAERGVAQSGLGPNLNSSGMYQRSQSSAEVRSTPSVDLSGPPQSSVSVEDEQSSTTTVIADQYSLGFDASWELDIFGGVSRRIEAADAELLSAIEAKRDVHVTLAAELAREYIELRSLQLRIAIAKKNLKAQQQTADLTRKRLEGGFANQLDLAYAESQAAVIASKIPQLEAAGRQKIYSISVLIGLEPTALTSELSRVEDIPAVAVSHLVPIGVPSDLLRRRPDIRRTEAKIHAATAQIGVAESDLYPKFYITGATAYQSDSADSLFTPASWIWSLGPSINWNLFNSGKTRANIEKQEALTDQHVIEYQQTVIRALQEVENVLVALSKEKEHYQALFSAVEANRKAVRLATILYSAGEIDFLEVLIAQRSLFLNEDALAQSRGRLSTSMAALYKAVGGGWDVEVEAGKGNEQ